MSHVILVRQIRVVVSNRSRETTKSKAAPVRKFQTVPAMVAIGPEIRTASTLPVGHNLGPCLRGGLGCSRHGLLHHAPIRPSPGRIFLYIVFIFVGLSYFGSKNMIGCEEQRIKDQMKSSSARTKKENAVRNIVMHSEDHNSFKEAPMKLNFDYDVEE
ncbi:hypothetical protein ACJIZ3_008703 [Penstemon smallii]|uniref:Transmembrane protein n=1 Tax=Penstemon smallii TaxID=265156 RepID=A0ABD3TAX7_9LAMI